MPLVDHAAEPDAEEGADLVREEDEAEQHPDVAGAEHHGHEPGGGRDGRQPQQPHPGAEQQHGDGRRGDAPRRARIHSQRKENH